MFVDIIFESFSIAVVIHDLRALGVIQWGYQVAGIPPDVWFTTAPWVY